MSAAPKPAMSAKPAGWLYTSPSGRTQYAAPLDEREQGLCDEGWTETPLYSADTIAALKKVIAAADAMRAAGHLIGPGGVDACPKCIAEKAYDLERAAIDAAQSTEMKLTKEKAMQPHQQRVVDEKAELDARREKLTAFLAGDICRTLPAEEQHRLGRQATIMAQYSQILGERIDAF